MKLFERLSGNWHIKVKNKLVLCDLMLFLRFRGMRPILWLSSFAVSKLQNSEITEFKMNICSLNILTFQV